MRENARFASCPTNGILVLSRYEDVGASCRHLDLVMSTALEPATSMPKVLQPVIRPALRTLSRKMLFTDPPDHTRLRALANRAFTPRAVEAMRQRIREIANDLLDRMEGPSPVDLISTSANWLTVQVIAALLGAGPKD